MLSGEAVVAIWNDITGEGRAEFYAWHLHEHMAERAAIPGFLRGRRYIATSPATQPEFFTLYEARIFAVLQGEDYLARLNAPSPWTKTATAGFRNTSRALATVLHSSGPGPGGALLTLRFDANDAQAGALIAIARGIAALPRITGAHLCRGDNAASGERTKESVGRTDIQAPPTWFMLIEATGEDALPTPSLPISGPIIRGSYRLEYTQEKPIA